MEKILYVVEAMGGGIFTYIVDLANELSKEFDVYIAYAIRPQTPQNYKSYFDKRVHLIEVINFGRKIKLTKEIAAVKELRQIAEQIHPDIIHLHSSKAGVIGRIAFDCNKVPVFYTPHGYSFLMDDTNAIKRNIYWSIEKWFAKKNCTIISCSQGEYELTRHLTNNAIEIDNAINVQKLQQRIHKKEKTDSQLTVFTSGRICYQKNPELFNEIAAHMPEVNFLWIGDGDLRNVLTCENIEITGWVDREEVIEKSKNADIFLLTSRYEGMPMALLEAMYMKKLCIVSNSIGNRDVIHNQNNGYICNNAEEFVTAINERNPDYIEQAYQDVIEKYEIKKQAQKYTAVYRERLKNS